MNHRVLACLLVVAVGCGNRDSKERQPAAAAKAKVDVGVAVAQVTGAGVVPIGDEPALTVVANGKELIVEGKALLPLIDGDIDPAEREGGASGRFVPRLKQHLGLHVEEMAAQDRAAGRPAPRVPLLLVVLPADAGFHLLIDIMYTAKRAGFVRYRVLVRRNGELMAVPLTLPTADEARPDADSAQLAVAATRNGLLLFSMSGMEGTIQEPKLTTPAHTDADLARVQDALVEIVARRPNERRIVAMFDADTPMQTVLSVLATVRARQDGSELLPDVVLSMGFL